MSGNEAKKSSARTIRTEPFRAGFPNLPPMNPKVDDKTGRETFSLLCMFPPEGQGKKFDPTKYEAALTAAMVEKFGADKSTWPKCKRKAADVIQDFAKWNEDQNKPLKGDWKGWTKIPTSTLSSYPPGVVFAERDPNGKLVPVTDTREIYGGRWMRAEIEAYHYTNNGGGVTFGLKNVQLLKRDEVRFGMQAPKPEDSFADDVPEEFRGGDDWEAGKTAGRETHESQNGW